METQPTLAIEEVRIARAAILDQDGRLLVLQRSDDDEYGPGQPDLPGGTLDMGETSEAAVRREVQEETGIDLGSVMLHQVCEIVTAEDKGATIKRFTRAFFAAYVENPVVVLSTEHQDFSWKPLDDAEEIFVGSTAKRQFLAQVRELRASGKLAVKSVA